MSKGQQFLSVSHAECLARAKAALQSLGYTSWGDTGNGSWGERQNQGAVIFCEVTVGGREVVDILVATEGSSDPGVPGAERERLQGLMERAAAPSGCMSSAYSIGVEPSVARTGQEISIRYTSQGEMHERDWIGIYPLGRTPNEKIDWVYTSVRRETGCQWKLIAPPPGEYEVAYLLDDSYDQVRARARFTVLP